MWDEVSADQQNNIMTGYTITYQSQTENDNENVQVIYCLRSSKGINKSKGVRQLQYHSVCIYCKGDGPPSNPIVVTTDQDSKLFVESLFLGGCLGNFILQIILRTSIDTGVFPAQTLVKNNNVVNNSPGKTLFLLRSPKQMKMGAY